jgi:hypothetical protein
MDNSNVRFKDGHVGPFKVLENIGANNYKLELQSNVRMHPLSHVDNLCACPSALLYAGQFMLRLVIMATNTTLATPIL